MFSTCLPRACVPRVYTKGAPWEVSPNQVRAVKHALKGLLPGIVVGGGDAEDGGAGGGGESGNASENRFWEAELPAFIERSMSSSITDPQALPEINDLFMVTFFFVCGL